MAKDSSFDIVSELDLQEVDNAVNQTRKEITQRYDFKGSEASIDFDGKESIVLESANEYQVGAMLDILQSKFVKRGIDIRAIKTKPVESAGKNRNRQSLTIQSGIDKETAKKMVAAIKKTKLKVQAQIQDEKIRVSGKKRDDLQAVMQEMKEKDWSLPLQFVNFRS